MNVLEDKSLKPDSKHDNQKNNWRIDIYDEIIRPCIGGYGFDIAGCCLGGDWK